MSDLFSSAPVIELVVANIIVPEDRQRKEAKADDALIVSIQTVGLINPIIVKSGNVLVAGERRLDAFRQLNLPLIPARMFENLPPLAAHLVELQENLARKALTWQEETKAVADYHQLRAEAFPGWTTYGTGSDLGFSQSSISRYLTVARFLADPEVAGASTFNGAFNLIDGRADRQIAAATARGLIVADTISAALPPANATKEEKSKFLFDAMSSVNDAADQTGDILSKIDKGELAAKALREQSVVERQLIGDERIINASFLDWVETYQGPRFDVLHCDFPYGKEYKGSNTRKTGKALQAPAYADTADVYFALVAALLEQQERIMLPEAHCIFWMDMMHYQWTIDAFTAAGWRLVQPFPLIWTKSYQGVASDVKRRPRHCYETALFFSRGDRKLRKLDKDHFEEQVDEKLHLSQKPITMLRHFLSLVVDEHTAVLDPTCGSGTALAAAGLLGASRILGVELEESNADIARHILQRELKK